MTDTRNPAAVALGSMTSEKKARAARENGRKGGRPPHTKERQTVLRRYPHLPAKVEIIVGLIQAEIDRDAPYLIDEGERRAYNNVLRWINLQWPVPKDPNCPDLLSALFEVSP